MLANKNILVTGGSGFIGSNFILQMIISNSSWLNHKIINLDKLTYAGNTLNLRSVENNSQYEFIQGDIADRALVSKILAIYQPFIIINFAAETHVDRSIKDASPFIDTNIVGTHNLLMEALSYFNSLNLDSKNKFRFLHISTDEVYGTLSEFDSPFEETTAFKPNSPYAASKAASDHLVRAYFETYSLPTLITNCSNNYGPYQFPEKLIPLCLFNALYGKPLPIYGDGSQIRDWLYVEDHCNAISVILDKGRVGETYNVGGRNEKTNLQVVNTLCGILDELKPKSNGKSYKEQITFIKDRPGHDRRYAINAAKLERELGWVPQKTFETGLRTTVEWFLENQDWVSSVVNGDYQQWVEKQYT